MEPKEIVMGTKWTSPKGLVDQSKNTLKSLEERRKEKSKKKAEKVVKSLFGKK
ncbi:MAG: hypothetical protein K0U98_04245 [Deltaproteobacteria bacterium]|nr:hypothetical protein [Deltaproteobacteria bacterium]